jgi:hypothetical protein
VTCDVHRSLPPVTLIHVSLNEAEPIVIERAYLDVPVFRLREGRPSRDVKASDVNLVASDLRQFIVRLLHEPPVLSAAERLGQPHSHFRRNAPFAVHQFR